MIHVVGVENTREYAAAEALRSMILQVWPSVGVDPAHDVRIIAGAKCHGQATRDIDVLLLARFGLGLTFNPFLTFQANDGQFQRPDAIQVHSLCVVFEVKDHGPESVTFFGTAVEVMYSNGPHSASEQSEKQLVAVIRYLQYNRIRPPHVTPLIWLRNVPNTDLPPRPHNIIGATLTWDLLLNIIVQVSPPRWRGGQWVLSASTNSTEFVDAADLFTKILVPTRLDRQRMERIAQRNVSLTALQESLGSKITILRGRGGTGKTMQLLQLAVRLYEEQDARVLLLTYNKSLVADIRRLLTMMGVGDDIASRAVSIQTVHSFLHSALQGLGIISKGAETFLEDYESLKNQALEYLRIGAVERADIEKLLSSDVETFRWDYVFVDEGQDCPRNERDLLLSLYRYSNIVVADGIDQLVRSATATNWRGELKQSERRVIPLKTCLRMKAGLARFVSATARHLGLLNMEWEANSDAPGGRVIVVDGPYLLNRSLHDRLIRDSVENGNSPVDMLFCIPPDMLMHRADNAPKSSVPSTVFEQWGYPTWDGAVERVRDSYPTDVGQLRIVQYESCRGLEGWTVVNLGLDSFYEHKRATAHAVATSEETMPSITGEESFRHQQAARWLFIPLTRAMDTLVIQLNHEYSPVRSALESATKECADYVEWISLK